MPKPHRGGKRGSGLPNSGPQFSMNSANPYQIPATLGEAIGTKGTPFSMVDAWFDANPYYSDSYAEFSTNCQRCVFAYELRRRGYDVEALPTYESDIMPRGNNWTSAMSGMTNASVGRTTENATLKSIDKQMEQWGDGSRAILRLKWAGGNTGHVVNVERANGKTYVYDAQSNKRVTGADYLKKYLPFATLSRTELFRTDNANITDNMRYMVKKK